MDRRGQVLTSETQHYVVLVLQSSWVELATFWSHKVLRLHDGKVVTLIESAQEPWDTGDNNSALRRL